MEPSRLKKKKKERKKKKEKEEERNLKTNLQIELEKRIVNEARSLCSVLGRSVITKSRTCACENEDVEGRRFISS